MASFLNNIEFDEVRMSPEQKLWRAVFMQALQDAFGICTIPMNRSEHRETRSWYKFWNEDFILVCENAGFDPMQTFEKLKRYDLIKKGIVWNYTTNGKRKFADVKTKH
jgi:hypothetical protein|tara:strand:+ start:195 stop:518 length:324 start_codon:yes stop_codon:yes gene_type:complete